MYYINSKLYRWNFGGFLGRIRSIFDEVKYKGLRALKERAHWIQKGSDWLETRNGFAHRLYLSASAVAFDPATLGRGFQVKFSDAESLVIKMPNLITNQSLDASLHVNSLVALGEFATRQLWMKTLDFGSCDLRLMEVSCKMFSDQAQSVEARIRLDVLEREKILMELRKKRSIEISLNVPIFGDEDQMLAEVETLWKLQLGPLFLGAQSETESN